MTPELATRYGAAFGAFVRDRHPGKLRGGYVLVGRDSRTSGEILAFATAAGLCAAGVDARLTGIAPTPTHLLAVRDDPSALGGLIVTASHNPVEWNGLKLASSDGRFVTPDDGAEITRRTREDVQLSDWNDLGDLAEMPGIVEHHVQRILDLDLVDVAAVQASRPRVVVDCVHGAGAVIVPDLLKRMGCEVDGIGIVPDGRFPRNPEPTAANLGELCARVRALAADVGFAVDPDSDRLSIVDERGHAIGEDWTLALAAEYVLARRPGPLVTNLSSSQAIEDVATAAGVPFHRSPVGEARVAAMMVDVGAVVGGEGNGGVMLPELNLTRDAPLACALIVSHMATRGERIGDLVAGRPDYRMVKRKVERADADEERMFGTLATSMGSEAEVDRTDGIRLSWPERSEWLHVRASGTEPVLRIIAESNRPARAEELADEAAGCLARATES